MITDVVGIQVGHWTDPQARTGCTVVLIPPGATASGEVRGGAPAEREFSLLDPARLVPGVDAVVLSGGSAFGLAAADGVVAWLEGQARGFQTSGGVVPIVVGMSLYDLAVGDPAVRPGPKQGWSAADTANAGPVRLGLVGAGTGAMVGKWGGPQVAEPGGIVSATARSKDLVVSSLVAVNAYGFVDDGTTIADPGPPYQSGLGGTESGGNTTIGMVATNGTLTKTECLLMAQSAHNGLARSLYPAHTSVDGDAFVAVATGEVPAQDVDVAHLRLLAQNVVTMAVRSLLA